MVRKPHNDYLEVFARTGLIGFALFIWLLVTWIAPIVRKARSGSGEAEKFCAWVLAASAVYLGVAAVQPLLSWPYGTIPLFLLLGMGMGAAKAQEQEATGDAAAMGVALVPVFASDGLVAVPTQPGLATLLPAASDVADTAGVAPIRSERKVSKKGTIRYSGWIVMVSAKRAGETVEVTESNGFVQVDLNGEFITKFSTRRPKGYIAIGKRRRRVA
jgi:hypothetical protein